MSTPALEGVQAKGQDQKKVNLLTSSRNVILLGFAFVLLFFGGLGGWMATAKLRGAVIAPGEIIVETHSKQVQHLDGGIVKEILVRDGDLVEKGQILIRLDGERIKASHDLYSAQLLSKLAQQVRLEAELLGLDQIVWPETLLRSQLADAEENIRSEEMIFKSRRDAKNARIDLLRARIQRQSTVLEGNSEQRLSVKKNLLSLQDEIEAKRILLEGKYLDLPHVMQLERSLNTLRAQIDELDTRSRHAIEMKNELNLEIKDLEKRYAEEASAELGAVRQAIADLRQNLRPVEDALNRLEIRATESGYVVNLNVRTEGGVIRGGEPLMEIVPRESGLVVMARVEPSKIDDVKKGQHASVSLSAFPMRYTPKVTGKVTYVSADRVESKQQGIPPHFVVYVEMEHDSLINAIGDVTRLTPGMPAEVFVQTGEKTVLSYLLTPITDSISRAFRE